MKRARTHYQGEMARNDILNQSKRERAHWKVASGKYRRGLKAGRVHKQVRDVVRQLKMVYQVNQTNVKGRYKEGEIQWRKLDRRGKVNKRIFSKVRENGSTM